MTDERLNCIKEQLSEGIALFFRDDVQWLIEQLETYGVKKGDGVLKVHEDHYAELVAQRDDARQWARRFYNDKDFWFQSAMDWRMKALAFRARDAARSRTPSDFWACEAPDTCDCPQCNDT